MKIKPLFLFALTLWLTVSAWAGTTTLTGTINDASGNGINGTLYMALPAAAQDPNTNVAISPVWVPYRLVNGTITGSAKLYDVNTINPAGLYYMAKAYDQAGNLVLAGNYVVTGASFNLGAAVPTSVTTSNISYLTPASQNGNNTFNGINSHSGAETFTGGVNLQASPGLTNGVFNNGSGFKHQRFGATCSTAASAFVVCSTPYTWTSAFADGNYTLSCTLVGSVTAFPVISNITSRTGAGFTLFIESTTAAASSAPEVDCIAVHD